MKYISITQYLRKENLTYQTLGLLTINLVAIYLILSSLFSFYILSMTQIADKELSIKRDEQRLRIEEIEKKISAVTSSKDVKTDYQINSIYAYSFIADIKDIQILKKDSKYLEHAMLEVVFSGLNNEQIIEFVSTLSLLGFVERIEPNKIIMHVKSIDVEDVRKILQKEQNKNNDVVNELATTTENDKE